jgi:hypothetical protein
MKKYILLSGIAFMLFAAIGCKKDGAQPSSTTTTTNKPLTTAEILIGRWTIVKDSVQTFDFQTPIQNPQKLNFSSSDYITFGKDSTATVSSQVGFDALYTDYGKYYINPDEKVQLPNFKFNYAVTQPANLPATLGIPNLAFAVSVGYEITVINSTSVVLHNQTIITKYPHEYVIKNDIYLSK